MQPTTLETTTVSSTQPEPTTVVSHPRRPPADSSCSVRADGRLISPATVT